jgi:hypothetical protein
MNCRGCGDSILGEATILGDKAWHPKCLRIASTDGSEYTVEDMKRRIAHLEGRLDAQCSRTHQLLIGSDETQIGFVNMERQWVLGACQRHPQSEVMDLLRKRIGKNVKPGAIVAWPGTEEG